MNDISGQPRALCSRHERYWPRRLLHIQSMRSFEKQESNTFGTSPPVHEPCYGTISYTWGRFELSRGSAISIYGIPWKPPSIDPRHFTVEQFENAIRSIASISGVEFLWLDVACAKFSHRPASATMDEDVSMQREIFSGASYNCIWLTEIEWEILADFRDSVTYRKQCELRRWTAHRIRKFRLTPPKDCNSCVQAATGGSLVFQFVDAPGSHGKT